MEVLEVAVTVFSLADVVLSPRLEENSARAASLETP
jgi:hypothetical protein